MKKFLSLLLSFTMLMTITAGLDLSTYAAETAYTCGDNITAVYDSTTKVLTISGFGDMPDYTSTSSNRAPWYSNRTNITTVVFTDDEDDYITSIGNYAFYGFSKITTIEIPASVTSIGSYAFNGCSQLTSIELPENVTSIGTYSFYQCTKLANVTLSEKLTEIPTRAFSSCTTLTSIDIPDSVTSIGERAFQADTALQTVNFGTGLQSIGTYAFSGCTKLNAVALDQNEELTSIDTYAFNGCTAVESITLNEGLLTIDNYAFYNCKSVTSLEIPSTVISIGNDAFESCSGIETAVVNGAVGNNAFKNCASLADLTLCDTITSIGTSAFDGSSSLLEEIIIPDTTTSIGDYAFRYCAAAKTIVIGEGVTALGTQAFANNANASHLETLIINAKQLSDFAEINYPFYRAGQASEGVTVIFGDAVENIPAYLFNQSNTSSQYLYNITSITLDTNVKNIGKWAFRNLFSLEELVINSESINDLTSSDQVFYKVGSSVENGLLVTFGDTVKNIPAYLFYDSATTSDNDYTTSITSLDLGESVETIGAYAFYYLRNLTDEIVVPNSTTTVGEHAFQLCHETSLVTGKNLTTVGAYAFQGNYLEKVYINSSDLSGWVNDSFSMAGYSSGSVAVTFGENVQSVPTEFLMMTTATSLAISIPRFTSVTFENADTIVDEYAFSNWIYLTDIDLPANTTVINDGILYSCMALQNVEIPESVTTIGAYAFELSALTSVDISASVTTIDDGAFYGTALESVTIPDTVTDLGTSVFASCDSLSSVTIGSGIDTLPSKTFQYCSALTDITIPDTITSIASYAFYASAVTNVTLSENLESIGLSAFAYCENLESLAIPSSVTNLPEGHSLSVRLLKRELRITSSFPMTELNISGIRSLLSATKTKLLHIMKELSSLSMTTTSPAQQQFPTTTAHIHIPVQRTVATAQTVIRPQSPAHTVTQLQPSRLT
ncbi:MAG: leucine-rich repeat domain-containing protein [Clostridiales bacterium]|nr:leucine-rich repeat domain-containing protein [Clostridiales bacterium]